MPAAVRCSKTKPAHLAQKKAYYAENREAILEKTRIYRAANREAIRARQRDAHATNPAPRRARAAHDYATIPERQRNAFLKKRYGITAEQYAAMLLEQNGVCAACGRPETRIILGKVSQLCVDHDHATGRVRHLLCSRCNTALGQMGDDVDRILRLAAYGQRVKDEVPSVNQA